MKLLKSKLLFSYNDRVLKWAFLYSEDYYYRYSSNIDYSLCSK